MSKLSGSLLAAAALALAALPVQAQNYGRAVAVGGGDVLVSEPASATRAGIVYVYRPTGPGGEWAEVAQLMAPGAEPADGFGSAVAVDGSTLLASRPGGDGVEGAVFAFERSGDEWRRSGRLAVDAGGPDARIGTALALDGATALVAVSSGSDSVAAPVYVLRRSGDGWTREAELMGSDAQPEDAFGTAVAVSGDWALVGAPRQASNRGAAYLFRRDGSGEWTEVAKLVARTANEGQARGQRVVGGSALGARVAFHDGRAIVAAPARDEGTGAVYVFERDEEDGWAEAGRLLPFDGDRRASFGAALAVADGELWVGTPGADGFEGAIYRLRSDADGETWTGAGKLTPAAIEGGGSFAAALAVEGDVVAASLPRDDHGAGTVAIFTRDGMGEWTFANKVWSQPANYTAVRGDRVDCSDGRATAFECSEVDLVSFMPVSEIGGERGVRMSDVWGWTDPETGKEYALAGLINATAFVDISDPENPVYLGELPLTDGARPASWRDIKVYDDHAFVVADGAGPHGMQVFDLTRLRDVDPDEAPVTFEPELLYDGIGSAHNLVINTESGFAYIVGADGSEEGCGGGLHMVDVRNPTSPRFAGCFADTQTGRSGTGYSHDAQCVMYRGPDQDYAGHEICIGSNETALSIADVSDKENPVAIARASYPNVGYTHQGWLSEDHRYFFMNDELDELQGTVQGTRTLIWDVVDLDDPQIVGTLTGQTESTDHNLYVRGDLMYQSNYVSGLRVIDVSDPTNPKEVGFFDTVPYGDNSPGFGGSWSNYPFFPSGHVIVTSSREGLFIVKVREPVT